MVIVIYSERNSMGQKINPISYRLQINKKWKSLWYKPKADFKDSLIQDIKIRELVNTKVGEQASIEKIIIKRNARDVKIEIHSSRPGILIGRQGQGIKDLKKFLINKLAMPGQKSKLDIDVMEIKNPDSVAQLVAQNIGYQLTKRIYYKRAVKHAMTKVMQSGVTGVKIQISGRLGGAEISRSEKYIDGPVPTSTLRANIDFAIYHSQTTYGTVGIKVWIYKK